MFFIFDCDGNIVGNPKGYKTHRGAQRQCNLESSKPTKIMSLLWDRFHYSEQKSTDRRLIYSIKWVEKVDPVQFMREHFQIIHIK